MGIFNTMKEPVFLKEDNYSKQWLEKLKSIKGSLNIEGQKIIDRDIKCLEYGIEGEQNIAFELKHSHMPMYILQDIYIEHKGLTAQIDYIIVTRKINFIIECKNLYGNIEINNEGDFIRTMNYGNTNVKEGIYSPVAQNSRHMELLKAIRSEQKNKIKAFAVEHWFYDNYKSIVVLANPKTILKSTYAKKEIKEQVIRADQLIRYIKEEYKKSSNEKLSDKGMLRVANSLLGLHREREQDEINKYKQYINTFTNSANTAHNTANTAHNSASTAYDAAIYDALKKYRLNKSREENNKPYYIFNNKQLDVLVEKKPTSKEQLILIPGFGKVKTEKYGDEIINIINNILEESYV